MGGQRRDYVDSPGELIAGLWEDNSGSVVVTKAALSSQKLQKQQHYRVQSCAEVRSVHLF